MSALSDVATVERIATIEREIARIRAEAYDQAGIPLPEQCGTISKLISTVCSAFFLSEQEIKGPRREQRLCRARFAVMWVARQGFGLSLPVIGRALGNRDHTTVISGLASAERLRDRDEEFRAVTDRLLALIAPKNTPSEEAESAPSSH